MSGGTACHCEEARKPLAERAWRVRAYKCNHSAFNGSRYTPSAYSAIVCLTCRAYWRTKADYAGQLRPDLEAGRWTAD